MNKVLFTIFCLYVGFFATSYAQDYSDQFVEAFGSCSYYTDTGSFKTDNMDVKSSKKISGFKDNKCLYEENITMGETKAKIFCEFTKDQVNEITEVMKAYNLVQKYSGEKIDTSSVDAVKDNPVVKVWSKYLQNDSVCKINAN